MNVCIYCKRDSPTSKSKEHVFPANLGCDVTLPGGYVCSDCNNYFADMDKVILLNRYIALTVGTEKIPNRSGKIRRQIGERLTFYEGRSFELKMGPRRIKSGVTKLTFTAEQSKEFDERLFARGIHKIAFNCFAKKYGQMAALNIKFDKLRRYIRSAEKAELWSYAVMPASRLGLAYKIFKYPGHSEWGWIVNIHLISLLFRVALEGWKDELKPQGQGVYVIRRVGQWQESSLLGLCE